MGQSSKLNHSLKMSTTPKDRVVWLEGEAPFASPDSPQSESEQALLQRHQQTFVKLHRGQKMHAESLMWWQLPVMEMGRKANDQECLSKTQGLGEWIGFDCLLVNLSGFHAEAPRAALKPTHQFSGI